MTQEFHCKKFNLADITPGCNIVIIGKRWQGKSSTCSQILYDRKEAEKVIFCSKYVRRSYLDHFRPQEVKSKFNKLYMQRLIEKQQENNGRPELVLAFDDVATLGDLWKDEGIRDVVRYGSSLGITTIFNLQYIGVLDETFIRNVDYVFAFRDNVIDNQKWLFEKFGGMFSNFQTFKNLHDMCSSELYRCLVIDLRTPRKNPSDGVFWYKSDNELPKIQYDEFEDRKSQTWSEWWKKLTS